MTKIVNVGRCTTDVNDKLQELKMTASAALPLHFRMNKILVCIEKEERKLAQFVSPNSGSKYTDIEKRLRLARLQRGRLLALTVVGDVSMEDVDRLIAILSDQISEFEAELASEEGDAYQLACETVEELVNMYKEIMRDTVNIDVYRGMERVVWEVSQDYLEAVSKAGQDIDAAQREVDDILEQFADSPDSHQVSSTAY